MKSFVFHSVRSRLAIPRSSSWPSERHYEEAVDYLTVDPSWFPEWATRAAAYWPDLVITFDDAYRDVAIPAIRAAQLRIKTIVFVPTAYIGESFPYAPYDVMNATELRHLYENGVIVGSHSHRHEDHLYLSDQDIQRNLSLSKKILTDLIGLPTKDFAPPHGSFDSRTVEIAQDLGFTHVWGTNLFPGGRYPNCHGRCLANMEGYVDESGESHPWPWET